MRGASVRVEISYHPDALRLRDRTRAVVYAYETGLVRPGEQKRPAFRRPGAERGAARTPRSQRQVGGCAV